MKQQLENYSYFGIHNHTDRSNFRLRDAINKPDKLLEKALEKGLKGIAITDHEALSAHIPALKYYKANREKFEGFKLAFGNEIYLVDRAKTEQLRRSNEKVKYNHFILIAKNKHGYEFLRKQSSKAWENSYFYRGMERVPTYYDELQELMKEYKGDVIASTACIGGRLPQLLLAQHSGKEVSQEIDEFVSNMIKMFGKDDFYFEIQPSHFEEQKIVNSGLIELSKKFGIKVIVSTDAHYLSKEQKQVHKIYLQASEGEREVDSFYDTTYLFSVDELLDFFDENILSETFTNTHEIMDKIESYDLEHETVIPKTPIPDFTPVDLNNFSSVDWSHYPYIVNYVESEHKTDLYYIYLIFQGMHDKKQEFNNENLSRINVELSEVWEISKQLGQQMSSYFVTMKDLVDIMWEVSLVGVSRGSASCFYTNYLIDIVQINAIKFDLPHWRFLSKERVGSWPDIDEDTEGGKRKQIIELVKQKYGTEKVLNIGTMSTEGARSSVLTACRGIGLDNNEANNILDFLPNEKGVSWNLDDAFFGNEKKNRKPAKQFINEVAKYKGLKETMLGIQGIVSGRGQHASGVLLFNDEISTQNAMMKTTSGLPITQYEMSDSEYTGGIKYDFLSINALDRIRKSMELLLKDGKIEWQGSLRSTYNKYFHPDNLDLNDPEMYQMLFDGEVINAFQFETDVGRSALESIRAENFEEIAAANTLMRLTTDGEQPIDKYIRFKNDINEWYTEMTEQGLTKNEQAVLYELLKTRYGICDTQELLMTISMSDKISGFTLLEANKLRKSVAKKNERLQEQQKQIFFEKGRSIGTSEAMLNYVWNYCFKLQFAYSFSKPHVSGYSLILMIEMNICKRYGSIYWKTACLSVNAGILGDDNGGIDTAAVAKALVSMKDSVLPPSINNSEIGFVPYKNKILFGLGSISGIGTNEIENIIKFRPYQNFEDFINRTEITVKKIVTLIKSGIFDEFDSNRRDLMISFVDMQTKRKKQLTTVQIPKIWDKIPAEFDPFKQVYRFRSMVYGRNKVEMTDKMENFFLSYCVPKMGGSAEYSYEDGVLNIEKKSFDKWYNSFVEPLKQWLKTPTAVEIEAKMNMREFWRENCMGNVESWEMETLNYYTHNHELDSTKINEIYKITNFSEMAKEPVVKGYKTYKKRQYPQFESRPIIGTVVDKNRKGLVYIVTPDNQVVSVRVGKNRFGYFNKKVMHGTGKNRQCVDSSWFDKGTKLLCVGYRRGNDFILNNKNSGIAHSMIKIIGYGQNIKLQQEKMS